MIIVMIIESTPPDFQTLKRLGLQFLEPYAKIPT